MQYALLLAIERIESAADMVALEVAVRAGLELLSFDDVAGSIPLAFCDPRALPADPSGAVAWTERTVLRFDFESQTLSVEALDTERSANG